MSLATLIMMATFLLPMFIQMSIQRYELENKTEVTQLLYEHLMTATIEQMPISEQTWVKNGCEYKIYYRSDKEVCMRYDSATKIYERCETVR